MAVNLEHEAGAGRARQRINRLAARTWIVLGEGLVAFDELPYTRALAGLSLEVTTHNVALGYRTQDQANQAALEEDQEVQAMLAELTDRDGR